MDLAIPTPIPKELVAELDGLKESMLRLQEFAVKINEGRPNEENSTMLEEHTCNHDVGKRCGKAHKLQISSKRLKENKKHDTMGELRTVGRIPFTKWCVARRK